MFKVKVNFNDEMITVQAKDVDAYGLIGVVCKSVDGEKLHIDMDEVEELAYDTIYDMKYNRELE